MTAGVYNIVIERGATFRKVFTYKIDNVAVNLTGYTARMKIRSKPLNVASELLSLTTPEGVGGIVLGGSAGTIVVTLDDNTTADLSWSRGVYDLELVSAGGDVKRLLEGSVIVRPEVTS
jgi:hypothetical protein